MTSDQPNLIFILGDQLSHSISSLDGAVPGRDVVLMCEVAEETTYVRHHCKKIILILSAMRHFADELRGRGYKVRYIKLDAPENSGSFTGELQRAVAEIEPLRILVTEPGEWRVLQSINQWARITQTPVEVRTDHRFICAKDEFERWASGRQQLTMEFFYREMRRKTLLLMEGDKPVGGKWNFDAENRKPAKPDLFRPAHPRFKPDAVTKDVIELVDRRFHDHMGSGAGFGFAVTRNDAEKAADAFLTDFLPGFGETQDAMLQGDPFLNHSLLSFYINLGLLDPLDLCRAAERAFLEGRAPLNAVEGFIRQIIGWREYMRGIYWLFMPDYGDRNFFEASRPLPDFFWSGKTRMNCLATVIGETIEHAYAHHIQRLMVTGNFALLAGLDPRAVHEWYLEVYADAFEWVEMPNVIGMSQFADGGLLGSKPYAASGAYISRMSDYCTGCHYDVRKKTGEGACPFNSLYWDFLARHQKKLGGNRRLAQVYASWQRMDTAQKQDYRQTAKTFLQKLDEGAPV
ncbi:cryptochrome/photolyase family protein [Agrobacterium larrymoorei]|uniref:cryptochrome/photolyase family protein n=1 Tax=Agrobacterium larrymoorei TaxID=160699 RepID=UPI0015717C47|nr:cryptochrome/photolyase family protein [Agrobacterium larrymoorei]NTJ43661.1 cryptochrome/photolyase family protein [Agrobacterium larrymoorei]